MYFKLTNNVRGPSGLVLVSRLHTSFTKIMDSSQMFTVNYLQNLYYEEYFVTLNCSVLFIQWTQLVPRYFENSKTHGLCCGQYLATV